MKMFVATLLLLLLGAGVCAELFISSDQTTHIWQWTPATGPVDHYIVEKETAGEWKVHSQVGAETTPDGFVQVPLAVNVVIVGRRK